MGRSGSRIRRRLAFETLEQRDLLAIMIGGLEFPTIQDAIEHAIGGNEILVGDGTYEESLDISRMGSAIGHGPGNLVIRGVDSVDGAIVRAPNGAALMNSAAFTANLSLSQLTIESPEVDPGSHGIVLSQVSGSVDLHDLVFREIDQNAVQIIALTGSLFLRSNEFQTTGSDGTSIAIDVDDLHGSAVVDGNLFSNVAGTALDFRQSGETEATFVLTENRVIGDPIFLATTVNGLAVTVHGDARLDLTLVDNAFENLSGRAIDVTANEQSALQTRWSSNDVSQVRGDTALQLSASGTAAVALTVVDNNILDATNTGMLVALHDEARIATVIRNNLFLLIGDDATDRGLVISSAPGSAASISALADDNTFDTISGDGLVVSLGGTSKGNFTIINNFFTGINTLGGTSATLIENSAGNSSQIQTTLHDNQVLDSAGDAFHLRQQDGALRLATTSGNSPQQQLAATNNGSPVVVNGLVTPIAADALDAERLLLLGDQAWIDENGDGIRQDAEAVLPFATLHLTGTETESGASVDRTTVTDKEGRYLFGALFPGSYTVTYEMPLGLAVAPVNQGNDDAVDSDFSPTTSQATVVLTADDTSIDLGVLRTWQNPRDRLDVNNDGFITANDVLRVVNAINSDTYFGRLPLPTSELGPPPYLDTNKDGLVTPLDVLQVINFLNARARSGEGEFVGPAPQSVPAITMIQSETAPLKRTSNFVVVASAKATDHRVPIRWRADEDRHSFLLFARD